MKDMKPVSIKLPPDLVERTKALKEKSGFSESAILRQAIGAGLDQVEKAIAAMQNPAPVDSQPA